MIKHLSKALFYISSFNILPPSRGEQERILNAAGAEFNKVDELFRNSLKQYYCHKSYYKKRYWFLFAVVSAFAVLPLLALLVVRGWLYGSKLVSENQRISLSNVGFETLKSLNIIKVNKPLGYLRPKDYATVAKIFAAGKIRPYFLLRTIWKLGVYRQILELFNPREIWVNQEMVFESSFLTNFLKQNKVDHVNFMHGDNFFSIQIAFSSFSKFYIWEDYYKNLFEMLCLQIGEYCVFDPMPLLQANEVKAEYKIFKYYAQNSVDAKEFERTLEKIMTAALKYGCRLVIRLHPLHKKKYEEDLIKKFNIELEKNSEKNIFQSLQESSYVCSAFSTVLYQAHRLNKKVVIDNTDRAEFELLKELEPIYLNKYKSDLLVN